MDHDSLSVVDDDLRVHGINNLRVVDASIMIAEKAADMILCIKTV